MELLVYCPLKCRAWGLNTADYRLATGSRSSVAHPTCQGVRYKHRGYDKASGARILLHPGIAVDLSEREKSIILQSASILCRL